MLWYMPETEVIPSIWEKCERCYKMNHFIEVFRSSKSIADMNRYGYVCMHTCKTLCSCIATTLVLQRAQDWYTFCTLSLYSIYTSASLDSVWY